MSALTGEARGPAPVLVFGWGNPGRGDDALGPCFVEQLRTVVGTDHTVDWLIDMQLQPEHVLDLVGRRRVLLVDASMEAEAPFTVTSVVPRAEGSITSHAMTPAALLDTSRQLQLQAPPCTLLAIRGEQFGFGETLSPAAKVHLDAALAWGRTWLREAP